MDSEGGDGIFPRVGDSVGVLDLGLGGPSTLGDKLPAAALAILARRKALFRFLFSFRVMFGS